MDIETITLGVAIVNFSLGLFVYVKNRRDLANRSFAVFGCILGVWAASLYFYSRPVIFSTLIWIKAVYFTGVFPMGLSLLYFSFIFPKYSKPPSLKAFLLWGTISAPLMYALLFTNLWVEKIVDKPWGHETILGPAYIVVGVYSTFMIGWVVYNLFRKYQAAEGEILKIRLKYMFLGIFLFVVTVAVIDVLVPLVFHTSRFFGLSPISSIFLVGFTALAITKYHLFEIKVILTELSVGAIGLILLLQAFVAGTFWMRVLGFTIFVLFCVFGYLLIKTTHQEIKRREGTEKLARSLARSERQIKEQLAELERAHERLKELDKMKDEFISVTSHELRTPMTSIQGYLWMLAKKGGELNERQKRYVEKAQKGSERMISLINDMLDISRIEQERVELDIRVVELPAIVGEVMEELKIRAEKKGLGLEFLSAGEILPEVKADSKKVRRVLRNLLDNAIKFTDKGGVTVDAYQKGKFVQVNITDTGRGISKEDLPRLFKKFGRLESDFVTAAEAGGTGLGLYISRALVERMGGKISVESEVGEGSTFSFTLPMSPI